MPAFFYSHLLFSTTELLRYFPQVSQQHWQPIHDGIKECFDV
jgi:hypothetical protein